MATYLVQHQQVRYGTVTTHEVGRYARAWRAVLAMHWHAFLFLGPYDMVWVLERP